VAKRPGPRGNTGTLARMVRSSFDLHRFGLTALYALAVVAVPVAAMLPPASHEAPTCVRPWLDEAALSGLWSQHEGGAEGDPVAFYYFHGDGHGLYRYGRVGLNNTHSFDYRVQKGALVLRFRKTGAEHRLEVRVSTEGDRDWLTVEGDPEADGATMRYFRQRGPVEASIDPFGDGPLPAGRLWIDHRKFATGGAGFSMYQFRPAGLDGRGVGWFHRGDFDDWSTEALTYRITGDRLELRFSLAGQQAHTSFRLTGADKDRSFWLESDPRDFWHSHRYRDAGPSFGSTTWGSTPPPAMFAAP